MKKTIVFCSVLFKLTTLTAMEMPSQNSWPTRELENSCLTGYLYLPWSQQKNFIVYYLNNGAVPKVSTDILGPFDPLYWAVYYQDREFVHYLLKTNFYPHEVYQRLAPYYQSSEINFFFYHQNRMALKRELLSNILVTVHAAIKAKPYDQTKKPYISLNATISQILNTLFANYQQTITQKINTAVATTQRQSSSQKILVRIKRTDPDEMQSLRKSITYSLEPIPKNLQAVVDGLKPRIPLLSTVQVAVTHEHGFGFASTTQVLLNPVLLSQQCSLNSQKWVIGHEVAHVSKNDAQVGTEAEKRLGLMAQNNKHLHQLFRLQEIVADANAAFIGADLCQGAIEFHSTITNNDSPTHPSSEKRKRLAEIFKTLHETNLVYPPTTYTNTNVALTVAPH